MRKTPVQLEEFFRDVVHPANVFGSEFVATCGYTQDPGTGIEDIIEADYEMYDKNADHRKIEIENAIYKRFGMSFRFVEEWLQDQEASIVKAHEAAIRFMMIWQRRTGTAPTALGNSLVSASCFPAAYDIDEFVWLAVLGDDSIGRVSRPMQRREELTERVARVYNLAVKVVGSTTTKYFCSYFVLNTPAGVRFIADPIKNWLKLGEAQIIHCHDGDASLNDRWISFNDAMRGYEDESLHDALAAASSERYPKYSFQETFRVIRCLSYIASDKIAFLSLYQDPEYFFF